MGPREKTLRVGQDYGARMNSRKAFRVLTARILFSLSALAASLFAVQTHSRPSTHDSVPRFVAPFVISAALENAAPAPVLPHPAPQETLALDALHVTPYRSSLWLVASDVAISSMERRHQRIALRC